MSHNTRDVQLAVYIIYTSKIIELLELLTDFKMVKQKKGKSNNKK